jgi:formylglycine-generating enzyme required for sulfatase activity
MSDIFISYASEDRDRVKSLAHALERKGWSVWWDRRIPIGRSFDEVIEEALDASKAVVVVWTQASVKSQWVKNEAREGLRRRVLFPVMILEEVKIPLEFRDLQTAHLMDWQPDQDHVGFDQLIDDLAKKVGAPVLAETQPKLAEKFLVDTTSAVPTRSHSTTWVKTTGVESWSKAEPAKQIIGKDGAPMLLIPAGEFWMGSPDGEGGKDEHPRHSVTLRAFYLDMYQVTNHLFQQFVQHTGYQTTAELQGTARTVTTAGEVKEVRGGSLAETGRRRDGV